MYRSKEMRKDPLFTMSGIGAEGFIYPSAILPYTLPVQKNKWAGVKEERERQKHEEIYGRKLLGMVIPKIGERPFEKMNMLQKVIQQHQGPAAPSAISIDQPFDTGSFSSDNIGSIVPNGIYHEKKEPYMVPEAQIPVGVGNHPPLPNAQEIERLALPPMVEATPTPQSQTSPVDTRTGFEKFVQSDFYKKLQDLFAGMAAAPSGGSGWNALASGVKHLNEGDKERGQVNQTVEYLKSKGYSEEEAAVMARNPQMLSALLTGGDKPQLDKGYEWDPNSQLGERRARPVKGSMQELEYNQKLQAQKEWEGRRIKNMFTTKQQLRAGLNDLKAAFELIQKGSATGFKGWFMKKAGGSEAYNLDKLLEGIRGGVLRTVFENLKSMSPSGTVGTGPISNFESQALSSMFGSLDVGRDKEGLERTLQVIKTAFDFFNRHNDLQLYNALTGQPIDTPQEISDKYFVDSPMSQGGGANIPIMKWQEGIDRDDITVFIDASTGKRIEKEEY
ncbi:MULTISPECIES: hypothetical protein [unclassified Bartonella]|uniref:hypothetical protein n=2 Tax=Bartonella TaxID=773 RepID=UPI0035CFFD2E